MKMKKIRPGNQAPDERNSIHFDSTIPIAYSFSSNEDWRFEKPSWDKARCIKCGVCCLSCPDGAIFQNAEGFYEADLMLCKGCGLCVEQCRTGGINLAATCPRPPWLVKNF